MGTAANGRFERLPERVDPSDYSIDVPASDPGSVTEQLPPAGSPELIAATQLAQTSSSIGSRRRPQMRIGVAVLAAVLGGVALLAVVQILF